MSNKDLVEKTYWASSDLLSLGTQMRNGIAAGRPKPPRASGKPGAASRP